VNKYAHWILPIFVIVVASLLLAIDNSDHELFRYDRLPVFGGEYWRVITGHLSHLGWSHLFLNMVVFLGFWFLFHNVFKLRSWLAIILICSISISLCFLVFDQNLVHYVGFSGVLHGLFIATLWTSKF